MQKTGVGRLLFSSIAEASRFVFHLGRVASFYRFASKVSALSVSHTVQLNAILVYLKLDRAICKQNRKFRFPDRIVQTDDYVTITWYKGNRACILSVNTTISESKVVDFGKVVFEESTSLPISHQSSVFMGLVAFFSD